MPIGLVLGNAHSMSEKRMRRLLISLLVAALSAAEPAHAEKIRVVTEEMAPYNFMDDKDRRVSGLATELVEEVLKRAKLNYYIDLYPWARSYRLAQDAPNVAIYSIGRNEEREKLFKWVGLLVNREVFVYKLKGRPELTATRLADLKPMRLGGIRDGIRTTYLKNQGLAVEESADDTSNIKKLQARRIDAFPIDEPNLVYLSERSGVDFDSMERLMKLENLSGGLYLAFSLQTPDDTVDKCRTALDSMVKDASFSKITAKWMHKK